MMKNEKDFDCVEMKRAASTRIHEELKGKSREEVIAYWQRKNEDARMRYPQMRELHPSDTRS